MCLLKHKYGYDHKRIHFSAGIHYSLKGNHLACISCLNCNCKTHFLIKNTNMGLVQI